MSSQLLLVLVCAYGALLFAIAWLAERYAGAIRGRWWRPLIYALSIGVYCSSWTFLGAVGTAVNDGWSYLPIYLGPILLIVFGWRFIRRLLMVSQRNKVTSIADFIGSRYGKNQWLAGAVTLVMVVGTLPYIALQLRAVNLAWAVLKGPVAALPADTPQFTSLFAALAMVWFAILFGARLINDPDKLRGMLTAVAVESVVKLVAFVAVALLALRLLEGRSASSIMATQSLFAWSQLQQPAFFTQLLLAGAAIICLPRQFHVMVVEYQQRNDLRYLRWLVPVYLGAFALLAIPVAFAAASVFGGLALAPDSYVLNLPRWAGAELTLGLTFLGALSAATGMVVVATVALSIMISNELIVPAWLFFTSRRVLRSQDLGRSLRLIRRFSIVVVLLLSWLLERSFSDSRGLASLGLISFAAAIQVLPAVVAGLYWPRAHARGVLAGLLAGMALWFYCLLLPTLLTPVHPLVSLGPWGMGWLSPHNLFGSGWLDPLSHGVMWSLAVNYLLFWWLSRRARCSLLDRRQAEAFTQIRWPRARSLRDKEPSTIEVRQLQALIEPLLGAAATQQLWQQFESELGHRLLPHDRAPFFVVQRLETEMAAIMGAMSAHRSMQLLARQQPLQLQDFVSLVSGSTRQLQFSQTLLQTTLENIPQGISVVDADMRLVAWNLRYQTLFRYPQRLLYVGCKIESIYQFNVSRGFIELNGDTPDSAVRRRLQHLTSGKAYRLERHLPDGTVLEIRGTPLANGGYVTTYTDITDHHAMLAELEDARLTLEARVEQRTAELTDVNETLQRENALRARIEQELQEVHASKSRFLAAASHDLLQPINAARLFVASLSARLDTATDSTGSAIAGLRQDVGNLDAALASAEQLISTLREISRLSAGRETARRQHFCLQELLQPLAAEAQVLAAESALEFRWVSCHAWVYSDPQMLRRVVQNFISNGLRYTATGRILLGCRRRQGQLVIEVWDTGPGIAVEYQQRIFEEFERLPGSSGGHQGLGLGLSIVQRIGQLLGHPVAVESSPGQGSVFRITVPLGEVQPTVIDTVIKDPQLAGTAVLCIDNEEMIQAGMRALLEQWGCRVETAASLGQALRRWSDPEPPALVLADYHLDRETGLDVLDALSYHWQQPLAAIIISADNSEAVRSSVASAGYGFVAKPVPPHSLRGMMRQLLRRQQAG